MGFLSEQELNRMGFGAIGKNVLISDKASIYNPQKIKIGSNVRIDDFCIISAGEGGIEIGNYVHIACYSSLIGLALIKLNDFAGLSSKVSVYSSSEDYSGGYLTNPTVPAQFKKVDHRPVIFESHCIIGASSVILPGVVIGEGTAIGALSLVSKSVDAWGIYVGAPLKYIKPRKNDLLQYAASL